MKVAAGGTHSLALLVDGTVLSWGDNTTCQLVLPHKVVNVMALRMCCIHEEKMTWNRRFNKSNSQSISGLKIRDVEVNDRGYADFNNRSACEFLVSMFLFLNLGHGVW